MDSLCNYYNLVCDLFDPSTKAIENGYDQSIISTCPHKNVWVALERLFLNDYFLPRTMNYLMTY